MKPVFANGAKGILCHGNMSILMALFLMDPHRSGCRFLGRAASETSLKTRNNMKQLVSKGATNPSWRCPTGRATDGHSGHGENDVSVSSSQLEMFA